MKIGSARAVFENTHPSYSKLFLIITLTLNYAQNKNTEVVLTSLDDKNIHILKVQGVKSAYVHQLSSRTSA